LTAGSIELQQKRWHAAARKKGRGFRGRDNTPPIKSFRLIPIPPGGRVAQEGQWGRDERLRWSMGGRLKVTFARVAFGFCLPMGAALVDAVDQRMQAFVRWYGEVPSEAKLLEDFDAKRHAAVWVRRTVGNGIAGAYVVAYQLGGRWWTLFFDRTSDWAPEGAENWSIEAYSNTSASWIQEYYYWPAEGTWRHPLYVEKGADYGRQAGKPSAAD
jgi:hypothetical protein